MNGEKSEARHGRRRSRWHFRDSLWSTGDGQGTSYMEREDSLAGGPSVLAPCTCRSNNNLSTLLIPSRFLLTRFSNRYPIRIRHRVGVLSSLLIATVLTHYIQSIAAASRRRRCDFVLSPAFRYNPAPTFFGSTVITLYCHESPYTHFLRKTTRKSPSGKNEPTTARARLGRGIWLGWNRRCRMVRM